jgi:hypothetical protein
VDLPQVPGTVVHDCPKIGHTQFPGMELALSVFQILGWALPPSLSLS